jgi:hypothetical protein
MPPFVSLTTTALLCCLASEAAAQQLQPERPSQPEGALTLIINAKVRGKDYQASGAGTCRHAPDASIRGKSASMWMVEYGGREDSGVRQLNLTLWRLKDGGSDQVSLVLDTKAGSHRVETGGSGKDRGMATVVILPNGPGGRFEIRGEDAEGKPIQVSIDCPAFGPIQAEGG